MSEAVWTEIKVLVDSKDVDTASAIANMVVPYGIYVEDYSDLLEGVMEITHSDLIDENLLDKDKSEAVIHVYFESDSSPLEAIAFLRERLSAEGIVHKILTEKIAREDWENNWKHYFKPLLVGKKLVICPSWREEEILKISDDTGTVKIEHVLDSAGNPEAIITANVSENDYSGRKILKIDPGMAFGTGGHETTRLVIEAMEKYIKGGEKILDVGCGSGILSIAALLLGADSTIGVDIDELAVKTAIENGEVNGFKHPEYKIILGNLVDKLGSDEQGNFNLIVANIVADAIIMLSGDVKPFLKEDGVYIVSGIISERSAEVEKALVSEGFAVLEHFENNGWVCMFCKIV